MKQKNKKDKIKYAVYYRVSTLHQLKSVKKNGKKKDEDFKMQEMALKNLLKENWPPDKEAIFEDRAISGKDHKNRPGLIKALNWCEKNNATLCVAKLDRLSRDLEFIAHLMKKKVKFLCADEPNANEVTLQMRAVFAQYERKMLSQRIKEGLAASDKPKGYDNPKTRKGLKRLWADRKKEKNNPAFKKANALKRLNKKIKKGKVFISKRQQADNTVIDTIKALHSTGQSYKKIAETLNKLKIPTRQGGQWWEAGVIRIMKRNNLI